MLAALALTGCTDAQQAEPDPADSLAQAAGGVWELRDPNGIFTAEVRGSGEGCAPNTWRPVLAPDGQLFSLTFSQLFAEIRPTDPFDRNDCIIDVKLRTTGDRSFAVRRFGYTGHADLDVGVAGTQTATYMFEGTSLNLDPHITRIAGPFHGPYSNFNDVPIAEQLWSPCGREHDLSMLTVVSTTNGTPGGWGFVSMSSPSPTQERLIVEVASRACSGSQGGLVLPKPAQVAVQPGVIQPEQPFAVSWQALPGRSDAVYVVEVSTVGADSQVVWQSPPTAGTSLIYSGPPLTMPSSQNGFLVVVVARAGGVTVRSDPASLRVVGPAVQPPGAGFPAWAEPLIGSYAMRSDVYSITALGSTLADRQLALADFVRAGDGLELRTRLCSKQSSALTSSVTLQSPDAYPEIRQRVVLENGRWRTIGAPVSTGFDRAGYPGCNGRAGQRVTKSAEQTWIRGTTCRCPSSLSDAPTSDDCRVTDPDRDGKPGLAYPWSGLGAAEARVSHAAATNRSFLVGGTVNPSGTHIAAVRADEVTFQLECASGDCGVPVNTRPCSSDYNSARFRRLGATPSGTAQWTCELVRQNRASLFPGAAPAAPTRCERDNVTEVP